MTRFLSSISLKWKAAIYFGSGFLMIWMITGFLIGNNNKKQLLQGFDDQLKQRADLVLQRIGTEPTTIPLAQSGERFAVFYRLDNHTKALYEPSASNLKPFSTKTVKAVDVWRYVTVLKTDNAGGTIILVYGLPSGLIDQSIRKIYVLTAVVLLVGLILSVFIAYWLSSKLLQPISKIVQLANATNIDENPQTLPENVDALELRNLSISFNRMLLRINEQSERQKAFFASASHELRTPLSVMQTRLELLLADDVDAKNKQVNEEQLSEVKKLIQMVNTFLLMSELQGKRMQIHKREIQLSDLVTENVATIKTLAQQKNLRIKIVFEPEDAEFTVNADADKLSIIISNLLNNAIKYADRGSVIQILLTDEQSQKAVRISNTIRADINPQIENLTKRYYHSKPIEGEGFGLGLWIAGELAALQDMTLTFSITNERLFVATLHMPTVG